MGAAWKAGYTRTKSFVVRFYSSGDIKAKAIIHLVI